MKKYFHRLVCSLAGKSITPVAHHLQGESFLPPVLSPLPMPIVEVAKEPPLDEPLPVQDISDVSRIAKMYADGVIDAWRFRRYCIRTLIGETPASVVADGLVMALRTPAAMNRAMKFRVVVDE
jgi:hypothetical protein